MESPVSVCSYLRVTRTRSLSQSSHISQRDAISVLPNASATKNKKASGWIVSQIGTFFVFLSLTLKLLHTTERGKGN